MPFVLGWSRESRGLVLFAPCPRVHLGGLGAVPATVSRGPYPLARLMRCVEGRGECASAARWLSSVAAEGGRWVAAGWISAGGESRCSRLFLGFWYFTAAGSETLVGMAHATRMLTAAIAGQSA